MMSSGLGCPFDFLLIFKEAPDTIPHLHRLPGRHPSPGSEDTGECWGEGLERPSPPGLQLRGWIPGPEGEPFPRVGELF